MKPDRIEETLHLLPRDSRLYCGHSTSNLSQYDLLSHRWGYAVMDPNYAWAFVMEFVKRRRPLPAGIDEEYLVAAHQHKMGHCYDRNMMQATTFQHVNWKIARGALNACLADEKASMEDIAHRMCMPVKAIEYYERLFFACRDRFGDSLYYTRLTVPHTRSVEFNAEYFKTMSGEDWMMFNCARGGGIEAVFEMLGMPTGGKGLSAESLRQRFTETLIADADRMSRLGSGHFPSSPAIQKAMPLMVAKEENQNPGLTPIDASKTDIGGLNMAPTDVIRSQSDAIRYTLKGITAHRTEQPGDGPIVTTATYEAYSESVIAHHEETLKANAATNGK